jgi:hypothetical protein
LCKTLRIDFEEQKTLGINSWVYSARASRYVACMRDETICKTQRDRILQRLRLGGPVPAPELHAIALQANTRILELRREGFTIVNVMKRKDGAIFSTYELIGDPKAAPAPVTSDAPPLFPNAKPSRWIDPEEVNR